MAKTFSKTNSKAIMTVHEVTQYLRLSQAKVYRLTKGGIPTMCIGKPWRFRKNLIDNRFR